MASLNLLAGTDLPGGNPDWLREVNRQGAEQWRGALWPTRKTEHWKYTSLRAVEQGDFFTSMSPETLEPNAAELAQYLTIPDLDAYRITFVNGRFCAALSSLEALPAGVELVRFADASPDQLDVIRRNLDSVIDSGKHIFSALNKQFLQDGIFLQVAAGVQVDRPVQTVWLTTTSTGSFHVPQRLLVVLGEHAQATVIEQFVSDPWVQNNLTHGVTELCLGADARLWHYRLHLEQENAIHLGGVHARLHERAHLDSFHLATGGTLKRIDVVINHCGERAHCEMNGVYLPRDRQHVDYHTSIEHQVPNCTTNENFRGIIADEAKAVFNGRIHIHPQAQKTVARLSNRNLLTSNRAEVNTKPELEIYADDVQCAHGATIAQLDPDALYYFLSRGISQSEAQVMLSFGFINELIGRIGHAPVSGYLRPLLANFFARDPHLSRHLA